MGTTCWPWLSGLCNEAHVGHNVRKYTFRRETSEDLDYCPFDISRKDVFAWRFILNENILFWLTISCQKPFVFYVSVFCSQVFTQKLKIQPKVGLTYAISTVK